MSEENQNVTKESYDKDFVEKVLTEKKNAMKALEEVKTKLSAYEQQLKQTEEQRLKEKEDWKSMAEIRAKEAIEWQTKYSHLESKVQTSAKLSAIKREFEKMGLKDSKTQEMLLGIVKTDALKYDEENQVVLGVEEEARRIKESIPMVFAANATKMNHDSAGSAPTGYTVEGFKELVASKAPIQKVREYQDGLMRQLAKK